MTEFNTLQEALDANKIKAAGKASKKHHRIRDEHQRVKELTPEQMEAKYHRCKRYGKTQRSHANGDHKRNLERKEARAAWQRDPRATAATFPV